MSLVGAAYNEFYEAANDSPRSEKINWYDGVLRDLADTEFAPLSQLMPDLPNGIPPETSTQPGGEEQSFLEFVLDREHGAHQAFADARLSLVLGTGFSLEGDHDNTVTRDCVRAALSSDTVTVGVPKEWSNSKRMSEMAVLVELGFQDVLRQGGQTASERVSQLCDRVHTYSSDPQYESACLLLAEELEMIWSRLLALASEPIRTEMIQAARRKELGIKKNMISTLSSSSIAWDVTCSNIAAYKDQRFLTGDERKQREVERARRVTELQQRLGQYSAAVAVNPVVVEVRRLDRDIKAFETRQKALEQALEHARGIHGRPGRIAGVLMQMFPVSYEDFGRLIYALTQVESSPRDVDALVYAIQILGKSDTMKEIQTRITSAIHDVLISPEERD
jgi:hypothetical protein